VPDDAALPDGLDLETASAAQLAALLAAGVVSSVTLVRAYLHRIERLDRAGPALHAIRTVNPAAIDEAAAADDTRRRGEPTGPLHGLPVVVKDNVDVAGLPTTAGSLALARSFPARDAYLVGRLRQAGAVILAKANLTEMANFLTVGMPSGYSALGGQVLNPYDTSVTPSGSSSGSAVAVAAGLAPLAVGTETNGSILSPAVACSVVGVKPTVALVSRSGIVPIAHSQDVAGAFATDVAGTALLLDAMAGPDPEDPASLPPPVPAAGAAAPGRPSTRPGSLAGARLGVVAGEVPPERQPRWAATCEALRAGGAQLVAIEVPSPPRDWFVLSYEFAPDLDAYFARLPPGAPVRGAADLAAYNAAHPDEALKFGQTHLLESLALDRSAAEVTRRYTAARAADLAASRDVLDALIAEHRLDALVWEGAGSADVGARAGYPSVALPSGYSADGRRPTGVTLLGPAWSEPTLLALAAALEASLAARRPPSAVNPAAYRQP
jgi:amidase